MTRTLYFSLALRVVHNLFVRARMHLPLLLLRELGNSPQMRFRHPLM